MVATTSHQNNKDWTKHYRCGSQSGRCH